MILRFIDQVADLFTVGQKTGLTPLAKLGIELLFANPHAEEEGQSPLDLDKTKWQALKTWVARQQGQIDFWHLLDRPVRSFLRHLPSDYQLVDGIKQYGEQTVPRLMHHVFCAAQEVITSLLVRNGASPASAQLVQRAIRQITTRLDFPFSLPLVQW